MTRHHRKMILLFLVFTVLVTPPGISNSEAAPSERSEYEVTARILNISGDKEFPDYRIEIIHGKRTNGPDDNRIPAGSIITARYGSGRRCEVNDTIEARLTYQCDEDREWINLYEVKIASEGSTGIQTLVLMSLGFIAVLLLAGFLLYLFKRRRRARNGK